jgi:hypothetical protein
MEFTRYIWRLYAESKPGREAIAKSADSFLDAVSIDGMMWRWPLHRRDSEGDPIQVEDESFKADLRVVVGSWLAEKRVDSEESAIGLFTRIVDDGIEMTQEQSAEPRFYYFAGADSEDQVFSNIAGISLALHRAFPEHLSVQAPIRPVFRYLRCVYNSDSEASRKNAEARSRPLLPRCESSSTGIS